LKIHKTNNYLIVINKMILNKTLNNSHQKCKKKNSDFA
jgi:hypothetical protein